MPQDISLLEASTTNRGFLKILIKFKIIMKNSIEQFEINHLNSEYRVSTIFI